MRTKNENLDGISPDHHIDITGLICPMTFVRTKLMLEKISIGDVLEVRLKGNEPLENVPKSARQHGHTVLTIAPESQGSDVHIMWIRKGA